MCVEQCGTCYRHGGVPAAASTRGIEEQIAAHPPSPGTGFAGGHKRMQDAINPLVGTTILAFAIEVQCSILANYKKD